MNGYNFTERVRKVLALSREQAIERGHEYVGGEHILLGLVIEGEGVACAVLQNMGVDLKSVTSRVDAVITRGKNDPRTLGPDLPYTSRAKKALELAMASARDFEHSYVGTEHLLLGLIREEKGVAAQLLTTMGATYERVSAETLRLLGTDAPPVRARDMHTDIESITVAIRKKDGSVETHESQSLAMAMAFLRKQVRG